MAKGQVFPIERIRWEDKMHRVMGWQLTSQPTSSRHFPYFYGSLTNGFSCDGKTILFRSQRTNQRGAPYDLFRVDADGTNLAQLSECATVGGFATATTRRILYYFHRGTLLSIHLDSFDEEEIAHIDTSHSDWNTKNLLPGQEWSWGTLTPDDRWYFIKALNKTKAPVWLRFATDGSDIRTIASVDDLDILGIDPAGGALYAFVREAAQSVLCRIDYEGRVLSRYPSTERYAHSCPLGATGLYQGCALPPERAILILRPGAAEPETLVQGPYFWHSSSSLDGQWILADTNWPNEGVQLICTQTKRYRTLFHPQNSGGHPQGTHPHPMFSPDSRLVAFNSDRTGIPQVYVAELPEGPTMTPA